MNNKANSIQQPDDTGRKSRIKHSQRQVQAMEQLDKMVQNMNDYHDLPGMTYTALPNSVSDNNVYKGLLTRYFFNQYSEYILFCYHFYRIHSKIFLYIYLLLGVLHIIIVIVKIMITVYQIVRVFQIQRNIIVVHNIMIDIECIHMPAVFCKCLVWRF